MKLSTLAAFAAITLTAGSALAQAPDFIEIGNYSPTDCAIAGGEVIVVGYAANGGVFRWTLATGLIDIGGAGSGSVRISNDGSVIYGTSVGLDGITRASIWAGGSTWTQLPGIGGTSSNVETSSGGISGDGTTAVGLGWLASGGAHAFRWTSATGSVDMGTTIPGASNRANDVNGDGSLIVGWQDQLTGLRRGCFWLNGVQSYHNYIDTGGASFQVGESAATNTGGSVVVGKNIFGGSNAGWRWDASTNAVTLLPNLPGAGTNALPTDVTDDGSIIVGSAGGGPFGRLSVIWFVDAPQSLHNHLITLGVTSTSSYADIGNVTACSRSGKVIVGGGSGPLFNQPGGWITIFPGAVSSAEPYCFGDGVGGATACPCAMNGAPGNGCPNSVNANGANLAYTGTPVLAADTLTLQGSGMPNASALYFQGTTQSAGGLGTVFGDGLRCASGTIVRLKTVTNVGGVSQYPEPGDLSVSQRGMVTIPGTRTYQVWYRNAALFCTASTFNLTNGLSVVWGS